MSPLRVNDLSGDRDTPGVDTREDYVDASRRGKTDQGDYVDADRRKKKAQGGSDKNPPMIVIPGDYTDAPDRQRTRPYLARPAVFHSDREYGQGPVEPARTDAQMGYGPDWTEVNYKRMRDSVQGPPAPERLDVGVPSDSSYLLGERNRATEGSGLFTPVTQSPGQADIDKPFSDIGKAFSGASSGFQAQAQARLQEGDNPRATASMMASWGVKATWGVFEGATFLLRPWNWVSTGQGVVALATDEKARGQAVATFMADPIGGLAFGAGGIIGGELAGQAGGKVADYAWGKPGRATTLTDVRATVGEGGEITLEPTVVVKKLPRGVADTFEDARPNRLLTVSTEEAVTTSAKPVTSMAKDVGLDVTESRVPFGSQRGLVLDLSEGEISDLMRGKSVTVKGLKGALQETPSDTLILNDPLSPTRMGKLEGVLDFKETQMGDMARGTPNLTRVGPGGLGMDDTWMSWRTAGETGPIKGPWDLTKPSGELSGGAFETFTGKVVGGARVEPPAPEVDLLGDWARGQRVSPTPGPRTPLSELTRPAGGASKLAQDAVAGDLGRLFKRGVTPLTEDTPLASGDAGARSIMGLKSTGASITRMTGDATFIYPQASSWGGASSVASGLGLLGRARARMDEGVKVGPKPITDTRPMTWIDNPTKDILRGVSSTRIIEKPDTKIKTPDLTDYWPKTQPDTITYQYIDHPPVPVQDHWVIQDNDHPPPPPPPPRPNPGPGPGPDGLVIPPMGPGGGLWGGPRTRKSTRTRKQVYQVADPLAMIGARTPTTNKAKKKAWGGLNI